MGLVHRTVSSGEEWGSCSKTHGHAQQGRSQHQSIAKAQQLQWCPSNQKRFFWRPRMWQSPRSLRWLSCCIPISASHTGVSWSSSIYHWLHLSISATGFAIWWKTSSTVCVYMRWVRRQDTRRLSWLESTRLTSWLCGGQRCHSFEEPTFSFILRSITSLTLSNVCL